MTDEQKRPARSRDEQVSILLQEFGGPFYSEGLRYMTNMKATDLLRAIAEAEARGAAEQRQKDAEGMKEICPDCDGSGEGVADTICCTCNGSGGVNSANVAALEGRIAELEKERDALRRQIQAMNPGSVRPVIHSPIRFMDDPRPIRKREGGVS